MVITPFQNGGLKCQVSDFSLLVDAPAGSRGEVSLRTKTDWPFKESEEIKTAGEYEIGGLRVTGFNLENESDPKSLRNVFLANFDEIKLCFLGELKSDLPEAVLDRLSEIDILFMPVGGPALEAKKAVSLVKRLEPSLTVYFPCADLKALAAELGQKPEVLDKLSLKKKDLSGLSSRSVVFPS
ncbi:MAG TPA: MBL fold metallo-hydrolase [Candidatus Tyrphobacter sp.]|nr:MBL fold metallo-hydrolase [Candidatus Tyrphobacter sp.]